jgi:hypothetical protein
LPKEGIPFLELFGGIGISLEAPIQSRMLVQRYLYVEINHIARQVAALKMMEFTTKFA